MEPVPSPAPTPLLRLPAGFDPRIYRNRYPDLADLRLSQLREHWRSQGRQAGRNGSCLDDASQLLQCLLPARLLLEIGPFDKPSLERIRQPGQQIDYADVLSQEEMRERARLTPGRNPDAVPPIRYVLARGGYGQIADRYDAVVSHHCVEHQPDLIGHLQQVAALLQPGGIYLFTMPDRRRCFDRFLPPTTLVDVLAAHLEGRTRPSLHAVIEHRCFTQQNWSEGPNPLLELQPHLGSQLAAAVAEFEHNDYVDVHCWKSTGAQFQRLVRQLVSLSYLPEQTRIRVYNFSNEFAAVIGFDPLAAEAFS